MASPADTDENVITHKTNDLAQATYLMMNGYEFFMEKDGEFASFVFKVPSDDRLEFRKILKQYNASEARVEPLRFMREVGAVRSRMYRFLDGDQN